MERCEIKVYTKFNQKEDTAKFYAIKNDNVIKYIDFENNEMIIDIANNLMIRENIDYVFQIDFIKNNISIKMKKIKKEFQKGIKTLKIEKTKRSFLVRYLLTDENEINEYYVKF